MSLPLPIKFGTDGWRGVIADTFTFENVRHAAQATADYFQTLAGSQRAVFVGHDVRFLSREFARAVAEVMAGNGFRVALLDRAYPTPYVSFEVRRGGFVGGIVITASHNPPLFNGFKVKAAFGGSAPPAVTSKIESYVGKNPARTSKQNIETISPQNYYLDHLKSLVDWDRISRSRLNIVVDSMHGCGGTILEDILSETSCTVRTIRGNPDPLFGGIHPEPMMPQLEPLSRSVRTVGADIGLATDGDADRIGIVDEKGEYVDTLQTLALLLLHTYRNRGWRGAVARTYSQSQWIPRIAENLGLSAYETSIGFKNIAELMLHTEILIGGEESGGIGLSRHLPERDGIFVNLLMLDLLATSNKSFTSLVHEVWDEFGEFHFDRRDLHVPAGAAAAVVEKWKNTPPAVFADRRVREVGRLDGVKVFLEKDSWILFRQSGTEPLLRVYCEAPTKSAVHEIMGAGIQFVEQFLTTGVYKYS